MDLDQELASVEDEMRALHETAGGADLEGEAAEQWDTLAKRRADLSDKIAKREQRREQVRSLAGKPGHVLPGDSGSDVDPLGEPRGIRERFRGNPWDLNEVTRSLHRESPERGGAELRSRALSAVEHVQGVSERSKQHITNLLESLDCEDDEAEGRGARSVAAHIIATSSPEYMRAWGKAFKTGMRSGQPDVAALQVLQRAASPTDAAGGYAVPLPIDPTLIVQGDGSTNPFRRLATVRTVVTDQLRTVNATEVTASYDAEAAEVSDDTPTWANTDISVHMARAFIPHSIEIGMDYPGFTQDIAMLLADAKDNLEATKFALGSGTGEPFGIVTALTGGSYEIASATTDTFALADVYKLDEELPARFNANASWVAHKKIYSSIRQAGGANLDDFWVGLRDGRPSSLLGHAPYDASAMDGTINATADNRVLILGDFKWYWIADRIGFSIELIPHLFHTGNNRPSGQRGVFAYWRNGADSVLDRAFRMLNVT